MEDVFFRGSNPLNSISLLGETLLEHVGRGLTAPETLNPSRDSEFLTLPVTSMSLKVVLS